MKIDNSKRSAATGSSRLLNMIGRGRSLCRQRVYETFSG